MATVLVIDDEPAVRNLITRLLTKEGYQVLESAYGQAGCSRAASDKPSIILLDLTMPVMDVFAVSSALRAASVSSDADGDIAKPFSADSWIRRGMGNFERTDTP